MARCRGRVPFSVPLFPFHSQVSCLVPRGGFLLIAELRGSRSLEDILSFFPASLGPLPSFLLRHASGSRPYLFYGRFYTLRNVRYFSPNPARIIDSSGRSAIVVDRPLLLLPPPQASPVNAPKRVNLFPWCPKLLMARFTGSLRTWQPHEIGPPPGRPWGPFHPKTELCLEVGPPSPFFC